MKRHRYAVYISDISYTEHTLKWSSPDRPILLGFSMSLGHAKIEMGHYRECKKGCAPAVYADVLPRLLMCPLKRRVLYIPN